MRFGRFFLVWVVCFAITPLPASSCEWLWVAIAATTRAFQGPSAFWKNPDLLRQGIIKQEGGVLTLNLPFHSATDIQSYPIIGYSRYGNPIIRMFPDASVFVPSQSGIPNFRAYSEKQSNLENVTYAKPIEAKVFLGDGFKKPQFVVEDGHHRFYGSYRNNSPIYVEISNFTFHRPKTLSWDQLDF